MRDPQVRFCERRSGAIPAPTRLARGGHLRLEGRRMISARSLAPRLSRSAATLAAVRQKTTQPTCSDSPSHLLTPDQLQRLFQRFTQADESTTRRFGGTGLGLALSRPFSHLLGGDVTVVSEEGRGTTFTLRVPAKLP